MHFHDIDVGKKYVYQGQRVLVLWTRVQGHPPAQEAYTIGITRADADISALTDTDVCEVPPSALTPLPMADPA